MLSCVLPLAGIIAASTFCALFGNSHRHRVLIAMCFQICCLLLKTYTPTTG